MAAARPRGMIGAMSAKRPTRVLIAGGGVAGLETLLALRTLTGPFLHIDILASDDAFEYRPVSVAEPFDRGMPREFSLAEIAREQGAELHRGWVAAVDPIRHLLVTRGGEELAFDLLVIALGGHPVVALPGALTFTGRDDVEAVRELLAGIEAGEVHDVAFALPPETAWPLPLYELALLTAAHASAHNADTRVTVVTSEEEPLELFGPTAGEAVAELLESRGIELRTSSRPVAVEDGALHLAGGGRIAADRVVALPRLEGPRIVGLPADGRGFIPVDRHGLVRGLSDVYAAGDSTAFPVKQGGIAAQQADAVAEAIAARTGMAITPEPFHPVVRGLLLTGGEPLYLRAEPGAQRRRGDTAAEAAAAPPRPRARRAESAASTTALWWPPSKIAGRHLAPYLATARPTSLAATPMADRAAPRRETGEDPEHDDAIELALILADYDARWGDYTLALRSLEAAESLAGVLPPEYEEKRRRWMEAQERGDSAEQVHW